MVYSRPVLGRLSCARDLSLLVLQILTLGHEVAEHKCSTSLIIMSLPPLNNFLSWIAAVESAETTVIYARQDNGGPESAANQ